MEKPNKKIYKKCIKCRAWKPRVDVLGPTVVGEEHVVLERHGFGVHPDTSDKLQTICMQCKNIMGTKARNKSVVVRIRHHTGTRCLTQLGDAAPSGFVAHLEDYLGYKIRSLVKHLSEDLKLHEGNGRKLRDALDEGYQIDHIHPLSKFNVV